MLTFDHVTKSYLGKKALSDVSLTFEAGKAYALAGPNGSGKSTLMKSAAGLVKPGAGAILLDGMKIGPATKARVAYMSTEPFFYDYMKIGTVGAFYADFFADFDKALFATMLRHFELEPEMKVKTLSSGMSAKLKIAATLARRADVVMLDEPLNGVDLIGRDQVKTAILKTADEKRAMIISSHLLDDLEPICDAVVMLKKGVVVLSGDMETLRAERGQSMVDLYKAEFAGQGDESWES